MRRLSGKLTYANVISTLCLVLLVGGGTAYAAKQMLPKNSVGAKQIKKGAITPTKLSKASKADLTGPTGATGPAGPQGNQGPKGDKGDPATSLFAQVNIDGTVNASGSPVTAKRTEPGFYLVDFGRDITHCAAIVNEGALPIFSSPGFDTGSAIGYGPSPLISTPETPGEEYAPGFPIADTVGVGTYSGSTSNDSPFFIAVFC
jgi:hypothetical protein